VAQTGAYPYFVSLDIGPGKFLCGATLISSVWVLTAAHCVNGILHAGDITPAEVNLIIGRTKYSDTTQGETRAAAQVMSNPLYVSTSNKYDNALIRLASPSSFRWARMANPGDPVNPGNTVRAVGHGTTCETGCNLSDDLLQVDLPIQSDATMASIYGTSFDGPTMIGAGPTSGGQDTCQGDSGGPIFVPGALQPPVVGDTSWGNGCARSGYPGVYGESWDGQMRSFIDSHVTRPANDNFSSAQVLSGVAGKASGSNTDATGEVGEPLSAGSAADTTVWYSWTAPKSGAVTFSLAGSSFDTTLSIYTGSGIGALTSVASNDDYNGSLQSLVSFTATSGTTYRIQVDGYNASWGSIALSWLFNPPPIADFDGDRTSDVSVFRPSSGTWYVHPSAGGADTATQWGASGDVPVPGDYDGDGHADPAIFRPSTGLWAIHNSAGGDTTLTYGIGSDVPVPGDYDGDGKTDIAVYRPATGTWFIHRSSINTDLAVTFGGLGGDIPLVGDFDGDGKVDLAIFRPASGAWFVHPSGGGADTAVAWGNSGDVPVPADFDGDGRADVAIFRPSTGLWAIHPSAGGANTTLTYGGLGGDYPVAADIDGDLKADIAIFRPSTGAWYDHHSSTGADSVTTFAIAGDIPLQIQPAIRRVFFGP
jgi:hypothetical protein